MFADYATHYTGISVVNTADGTTSYYGLPVDDGTTINLGNNPLLQRIPVDQAIIVQNMLQEMANVEYTPFTATMLGGVHYDLGDVLTEAGGLGAGSTVIITSYDYTFNVGYEMSGVGANPQLANVQSKTDKNIQNLLANTNKNEFRDYEQKNAAIITIGDNEEINIISTYLASNNNTKALIHIEINLESAANVITDTVPVDTENETVDGEDIFTLVSDKETRGTVRYFVDADEAVFRPVEQWTDGKHVLHLMYVLPLVAGVPTQFRVYMRSDGGQIIIPRDGLWFYGSGRGLVGDGNWGGFFDLEDQAADWNIIDITFNAVTESVSVDTQTPVGIDIADVAANWNVIDVSVGSTNEMVTITLRTRTFPRITQDGNRRITEDGNYRYTEGD